jgi:hypothetical protein
VLRLQELGLLGLIHPGKYPKRKTVLLNEAVESPGLVPAYPFWTKPIRQWLVYLLALTDS